MWRYEEISKCQEIVKGVLKWNGRTNHLIQVSFRTEIVIVKTETKKYKLLFDESFTHPTYVEIRFMNIFEYN